MKIKKKVLLFCTILIFSVVLSLAIGLHYKSKDTFSDSINIKATKISDALTIDQLVDQITEDTKSRSNVVRKQLNETFSNVFMDGKTYRVITTTVPLWSQYQPTVRFYCQTIENTGSHGISKVISVHLNQEYCEISKKFCGTLFLNLENPHTIYFELNGDFYNTGTMLPNIGWGNEDNITLNYKISDFSNYYGTADYIDRVIW